MSDLILEDCAGNQYRLPGIRRRPDVRGVVKLDPSMADAFPIGECLGPILLKRMDAVPGSGYLLTTFTFLQVGKGIGDA